MKMLSAIIALCSMAEPLIAQTVYEIPFMSKGNVIEIAVEQTGTRPVSPLTVSISNVPEWLTFEAKEVPVTGFAGGEEQVASFPFSVGRSAPVGKEQKLIFTIATPGGEQWTRAITVSVLAPESFELFQNYPNPFNGETKIGYEMKERGWVRVSVHDLLGRDVAVLVDCEQPAGRHEVAWDASDVATGTYISRLSVRTGSGEQVVRKMRMILLK